MKKKLKNEAVWIFWVLVLISLFIRLMFISGCLFHHDSVQLARAVEGTVETGKLQPTVSGRYGFVIVNTLLYPALRVFSSDTDFILNLITILFSSFSIGFLFLFLRRLTKNVRVAAAASMLFSFTPLFLSVTVYAKSHGMAFFFAVTAAYYLLRLMEKGGIAGGIIFSALFLFSLLIRSTNLYYAFPFLLIAMFFGDGKKGMRERAVKYASYIIGVALVYLVFNYGRLAGEMAPNRMFLSKLSVVVMLFKESLTALGVTLTILGLLMLLVGAYSSIKEKRKALLVFALLWFLPYFLYISIAQTFSARFLIPVLVPVMLLVALGFDYLYRKIRPAGIAIFLLLLLAFLLVITPIIRFRHDYCGPEEFALFVKGVTEEGSYIIANDESVFFQYYGGRKTLSYPLFAGPETVAMTVKQYYDILMENGTIYVPDKMFFYSDPKQSVLVTLEANFILEKIGTAVNEEYHHAELASGKRNESIYRLRLNPEIPLEEFRIMALGKD
jgi:hypothetical protein